MDRLTGWKDVGLGFAGLPTTTRSTPSGSTTKAKPKPSQSRPPPVKTKQALLFSRDKTPRSTPRESTSSSSSSSRHQSQSKLSSDAFTRRQPFAEKDNQRSNPNKGKGKGIAAEDDHNRFSSSNSSSAEVSESLLHTTRPTTSRWKGRLSRNHDEMKDTTTSRDSLGRKILYTTTKSARMRSRESGVTIDFDSEDDAEFGEGESARKRRRREDRGGFGKLDLANAEDVDRQETEQRKMRSRYRDAEEAEVKLTQRKSELSLGHLGQEEDVDETVDVGVIRSHDYADDVGVTHPEASRHLRPVLSTSRGLVVDRNPSPTTWSTQSSDSAEDVQARLVRPYQPKTLVPDTPPSKSPVKDIGQTASRSGEVEEPETEDEEMQEATKRASVKMAENKGGETCRSDDSGFVEAEGLFSPKRTDLIDLSHSSSPRPSSSPSTIPQAFEDEDVPDSQPSSVGANLAPLSSSPVKASRPRKNRVPISSSPVVVVDTASKRTRDNALERTASWKAMPPPVDTKPRPRPRLRRGPPPRLPSPVSSSPPPPTSVATTSKVLVEDTQDLNLSLSTKKEKPEEPTQPYRTICEETQYDVNDYYRLPSDLPHLASDEIRLPTPRALRPPKSIPRHVPPPPRFDTLNNTNGFEVREDTQEGEQIALPPTCPTKTTTINLPSSTPNPIPHADESTTTHPLVGAWSTIETAWKGQRSPTPPPPPQPQGPRQSRLTDHFILTTTTSKSNAENGDGEVVVEDSQGGGEGIDGSHWESLALERVWRENIVSRYRTNGNHREEEAVEGVEGVRGSVEEEVEEVDGFEDKERKEDELVMDASSPLSSLPDEHEEGEVRTVDAASNLPEIEEVDIIPDSDPEDDAPIFAGTFVNEDVEGGGRGGNDLVTSPLGKPLRDRFPSYRLPEEVEEVVEGGGERRTNRFEEVDQNVVDVEKVGSPIENRNTQEGGVGIGEGNETMWESYWTMASQQSKPTFEDEEEESSIRLDGDITLEDLLRNAPEDDSLPNRWTRDRAEVSRQFEEEDDELALR